MNHGEGIRSISIIGQSNQRTRLIYCRTKVVTPTYTHAYKYNPSTGPPSCFVFMILSLAERKSSICTRMRRSLSAINPASVQIARISAPDRSSFWLMNSSRSTSSLIDIFEVCKVKIFFFVFSGCC